MSIPWAEDRFNSEATRAGYKVYATGWPDFVIEKDQKIIFVEVKIESDCLSGNQLKILRLLERYGLNVRVSIDGSINELMTLAEFRNKRRKQIFLAFCEKCRRRYRPESLASHPCAKWVNSRLEAIERSSYWLQSQLRR